MQIHGGEGKTENIKLDFSVNVNPLGMPESVRHAYLSLSTDPSDAEVYPDRTCKRLREAAAGHYQVPAEWIACGCGASEMIYKIAYLYRGCSALVLSPGFGEYEKALKEAGCAVSFLDLKKEREFAFDEDFYERFRRAAEGNPAPDRFDTGDLPETKTDLVFLCSPNNPVGGRIPEEMLRKILNFCLRHGIRAVVDECFLPFVTGEEPTIAFLRSLQCGTESFSNQKDVRPVILKALTKSHAIPGIRLGFAVSSDTKLIRDLQDVGAPWTVSGIAQKLGEAAFVDWDEEEFRTMRKTVAEERAYLVRGLTETGAKVFPGEGNFILFSAAAQEGENLFEFMRSHGILIRSCESFRGLGADFCRIAVRTRPENEIFLRAFREWKSQLTPG